jgi:hypothetical protein
VTFRDFGPGTQGLREKNKNLYEKVQMCETWKATASAAFMGAIVF